MSGIDALNDALRHSSDLRGLARALGCYCLDHAPEISSQVMRAGFGGHLRAQVRFQVARVPGAYWNDTRAPHDLLPEAVAQSILPLLPTPGLAILGFLEGLCATALADVFANTFDEYLLERGDPFPLPERDLRGALKSLGPHPCATVRRGSFLVEQNFQIFSGFSRPVILSFADRYNLDAATFIDAVDGSPPRLPTVATVHPFTLADLTIPPSDGQPYDEWWFGVRPSVEAWNHHKIKEQLDAVRSEATERGLPPCQIAVLPEMSLPEPDALEDLISEHHREWPELIVAGSSHPSSIKDDGAPYFVNETRAYLNGVLLLRHQKLHPYVTDELGLKDVLKQASPERLTDTEPRLMVAAGRSTRLAVLICADVLDSDLQRACSELCINVLLVPTLSVKESGVDALLTMIAGTNQGIGVSVNEVVAMKGASKPSFAVATAVPVSSRVLEYYDPPGSEAPLIGLVDFAAEPRGALVWL